MQLITPVNNMNQLLLARDAGLTQVILGHYCFSRFGRLKTQELHLLAEMAISFGMTPVFEWDILMTENIFTLLEKELSAFKMDLFKLVRVQDMGALEYVLEHFPKMKIQLVLENGNHNLIGLQSWVDFVGPSLERLVLSNEIPSSTLATYIEELKVPVEYLILGRVLLFYSPRSLLSPLEKENYSPTQHHWIEALGESEESPHKGFPLLENRHGTFMFHIKDFYLVEQIVLLSEMNLAWGRVDFSFEESCFTMLADLNRLLTSCPSGVKEEDFLALKQKYPRDVMRGFFHVNKSDVLFPKLKNIRLNRKDQSYLGDVLEASKTGQYLAIKLRNPLLTLKLNDRIKIVSPEGEEKILEITSLRNSNLHECESMRGPQLAIINFVNGMVTKSVIYKL